MKIRISLRGNKTTAGSVYSNADMAAAEQQEPSDEELAERDKDEKAREEVAAEKERKAAAEKAKKKATEAQKTPAEKGEAPKADAEEEEDDSEDEEESDDDSEDAGDDEEESDDSDDSEDDEEESDDSEDDEEEDDEESTASAIESPFAKNEFIKDSILETPALPAIEPADALKKAEEEAALEATPDDPNAKMEKPKSDTTKDMTATASAYYETLPYKDVLPVNSRRKR